MTSRGTRTVALIPAWNEEESIGDVLSSLQKRHPDFDILVIDDGSTDRTADIAEDQGAYVASLPFNLGIGAALRTGFQFAAHHDYDRAFQFDADGQHDSIEVSKLMERLDGGADLVIGSRFLDNQGYEVGSTRGLAMQFLRWMIQLLVGTRFTDTSSGFRGFSRPMIKHFATEYPREYMDSVEALVNASYHGFHVVEVPVTMHERAGGTPSNRSIKLLYHYVRLWSVLVLTFSRRGRQTKRSRTT